MSGEIHGTFCRSGECGHCPKCLLHRAQDAERERDKAVADFDDLEREFARAIEEREALRAARLGDAALLDRAAFTLAACWRKPPLSETVVNEMVENLKQHAAAIRAWGGAGIDPEATTEGEAFK